MALGMCSACAHVIRKATANKGSRVVGEGCDSGIPQGGLERWNWAPSKLRGFVSDGTPIAHRFVGRNLHAKCTHWVLGCSTHLETVLHLVMSRVF